MADEFVRSVLRRRRLLIGVLGLMAPIGATRAQDQRVAAASAERRSEPRLVTLEVKGVPLTEALHAIAVQAGLVPVIEEALIPSKIRVTLHLRAVVADLAFQVALQGTGLVAKMQEEGHVIIVRAGAQVSEGVVVGEVLDKDTRQPISGATVAVAGTKLSASTNDHGVFRLPRVPAGAQTVSVRRLGYHTLSQDVSVKAGASITVRVALEPGQTVLREVVTTGTGDRARLEVGNAVATIQADSIAKTTLLRNMSDLLTARAPSVVVSSPSGLVGSPSRIRIRGINSIALNNDPIIILDGMRLVSQTTPSSAQTNVGPARITSAQITSGPTLQLAPSRLDDIDPNTIESIDILRGPSASSLYGTDAANGVIVIKTKRGQPGKWRLTLVGDDGWSVPRGDYPENWFGWTHLANGAITNTGCKLARLDNFGASLEDGTCMIDSVTSFQAQNDPRMRGLGTGATQNLSASISGGTAQLQQFFAIRGLNNIGGAKMPDIQKGIIAKYWTTAPPSWMLRPNTEKSYNGSSRTTFEPMPSLNASVTAEGTYRNVLNNGTGMFANSAKGPYDTLTFLPGIYQRARSTSLAKRGFSSANATYLPLSWLTTRATVGGDYTLRTDEYLLRSSDCTPVLEWVSGTTQCASAHVVGRGETFVKTVDAGLQLAFDPTRWLNLRTAVGEQYNGTQYNSMTAGNNTNSTDLAFGSELITPAPIPRTGTPQLYAVSEGRDQGATAGWYLEQTAALSGRFFMTAGFRRDVASAFGSNVNAKAPVYPKFNASWLLSEEPFFPRLTWLSSFRMRGAYGHSGTQASQTSVLGNYLQSRTVVNGTDAPGILLGQLGNPDLKPERVTEWEGGFDLSLYDDRFRVELSRYKKLSRDAITNITLPPSYGIISLSGNSFSSNLTQSVNLGSVENRGLEVSATMRVVDRPTLGWTLTVNASHNTNTLVTKSPTLSPTAANGTQFVEGYPLYGYWGYPILSYADQNGDGILQRTELSLGAQSFMGAPYPKSEITYLNSFSLLRGTILLNANVDQINGLSNKFNVSNLGQPGTRGLVDRTAPLGMQAAAMQAFLQGGFISQTTSVRLAELSLTYVVPPALARRALRAQSAALTFAGRNIALWTNYVGADPNMDTSGLLGDATVDGANGAPTPRQWTIRLNLGF